MIPGRSRSRIFVVWFALALVALGAGCATIPEDQVAVKDLRIEGASEVDEDDIKDKILTTEPTWPFEVELFDPTAWQADLRRIERYYETRGYYQARVVQDEVIPAGEDHVSLLVKVEEGQPTHIAEIRIEGLDPLTPEQRKVVLEEFTLREGEIFSEDAWTAVKPMLRGRLREMGYAEAVVGGKVEVDVDSRTARVLLQVEPGQRYQFGAVFVATDPNPRVPPRWIVEAARESVEQGQWYSESALADAQARVFKMGVFGGVRVTRGAANREESTVPVVVDVREAPFRTVRYGGGIGLDQTRNEIRVLAEYTNRNFFGGLRLLSARTRAGWAFLPNVVDVVFNNPAVTRISEPLASALVEFQQPRVLLPTLRYFVSGEGELRPEQAFTVFALQGRTGLAWSPHPSLTAQLSYNLERDQFLRGGGGTVGGSAPPLAFFGCPGGDTRYPTCFLSFAEVRLEWDRRLRSTPSGVRLDPIDPTWGYYLGASLQYGGGPLGGDFTYVRLLPEARGYASVLGEDRLTIGGRVQVGTLLSPQETSPITSRFYAGGGTSMRGFYNRRLSPLTLVMPTSSTAQYADVVPTGGERLFEGSLEARYRFNPDFHFAAFVDFGFNNPSTPPDGEDINVSNAFTYFARYTQYAVGAGLRYITLVGPIRVDVAYRLPFGVPPPVGVQEGTTLPAPPGGGCFGLGTQPLPADVNPEGHCALHISIGEAF